MLYWLLVFIGFIILLIASNFLLKVLKRRGIKINRWVWAAASFLIVIIPKVIFPKMSAAWTVVLLVFCCVFAINFMTEQHQWMIDKKI
ncbi:diacylglycerol kinase [Lapidilactobacillus bayanensis]|uniref:diacylglycerol kinase n=1 Tax=Lapidilactobacillus bayanensis TaxID=2485998 RepID=UPI000F793EE0|nr:diacylglycerol kinase [Lapidilactobacillus bayanensis]